MGGPGEPAAPGVPIILPLPGGAPEGSEPEGESAPGGPDSSPDSGISPAAPEAIADEGGAPVVADSPAAVEATADEGGAPVVAESPAAPAAAPVAPVVAETLAAPDAPADEGGAPVVAESLGATAAPEVAEAAAPAAATGEGRPGAGGPGGPGDSGGADTAAGEAAAGEEGGEQVADQGAGEGTQSARTFGEEAARSESRVSILSLPVTEDGNEISFTVPPDVFVGGAGEAAGQGLALGEVIVEYKAALKDGGPLPGWLSFNPDTGTFAGEPPRARRKPCKSGSRRSTARGMSTSSTCS